MDSNGWSSNCAIGFLGLLCLLPSATLPGGEKSALFHPRLTQHSSSSSLYFFLSSLPVSADFLLKWS